jgi:hypothetical protein
VDLKDFDVRKVPRTAGLIEQAAYGRRGVDGLVEQVCNEARVPCEHEEWPGFTVTTGQEQDTGFYSFIDKHRDREIAGRGLMVIRRLRNEWDCTTGMQRRERASDRTSGFQWPPLAELRARFEERFGKQAWANAQVTEWTVPKQDEPEQGESEHGRRKQTESKWASELTGQTFTRRLVLEEERDWAVRVSGDGVPTFTWLQTRKIKQPVQLEGGIVEITMTVAYAKAKHLLGDNPNGADAEPDIPF